MENNAWYTCYECKNCKCQYLSKPSTCSKCGNDSFVVIMKKNEEHHLEEQVKEEKLIDNTSKPSSKSKNYIPLNSAYIIKAFKNGTISQFQDVYSDEEILEVASHWLDSYCITLLKRQLNNPSYTEMKSLCKEAKRYLKSKNHTPMEWSDKKIGAVIFAVFALCFVIGCIAVNNTPSKSSHSKYDYVTNSDGSRTWYETDNDNIYVIKNGQIVNK